MARNKSALHDVLAQGASNRDITVYSNRGYCNILWPLQHCHLEVSAYFNKIQDQLGSWERNSKYTFHNFTFYCCFHDSFIISLQPDLLLNRKLPKPRSSKSIHSICFICINAADRVIDIVRCHLSARCIVMTGQMSGITGMVVIETYPSFEFWCIRIANFVKYLPSDSW